MKQGWVRIRSLTVDEIQTFFKPKKEDRLLKHGIERVELYYDALFNPKIFNITSI